MVSTANSGWEESFNMPTVPTNNEPRDKRVYSYAEAIDLTGNGAYSIGLLVTLSMTTLAMGVDMFGFSVVVTGCTCDFGLDISQTSILLSMPFVGPIMMAYPWGYISDTQGRRCSLLIAMWVSFVVSTISAFSPNWVVLAVLKFISTSFCSCAQSASYTLLGESCSERFRDSYMLIMTSVLDFSLAAYVGVAYFVLNLDFSSNMGFITFAPWRLLSLALALPLGMGAFGTHFFYESPKFLVNAGREDEALDKLAKIWKRNGRSDKYPVKRIVLNEIGNEKRKDVSLIQSLLEQIVPLFKPPLLYRTIQLYFLTAVIFSTNNSFFIWFPYLAEKIGAGLNSSSSSGQSGLCNMIITNTTQADVTCSSKIEIALVWASLAQGVVFVIIMVFIANMAHRKKLLMIIIMTVAALCALGAVLVREVISSFILFCGLLLNELCIGFIYTYIVDLYPTSYRGMAACIAVMVARTSALGGVNVLGAFIMSHCKEMFYISSALMLMAVIVSFLLPPDKRKA